jgi:hypothetical protein
VRKPLGSHKFLQQVVCNRCGHKEQWTPIGLDLIRRHITECQPDLARDAGHDH